jgi:siroheme synthase-like protein
MEEYPFFPLFVDLSKKKIVVVGAGKIAKRRIEMLSPFTETVKVIAPEIHPGLLPLEEAGKLHILRKNYESADLDGAELVLSATNSAEVNDAVWHDCRRMQIPVNVSSDRRKSDFYFPGIAQRDNVVIGVTASGKNHAQAKELTEELRKFLESY